MSPEPASSLLKSATNEFWLAWMFLTRFPAPVTVDYSEANLNRAARFFPWVGLVLGLLQTLVFLLAMALFQQPVLAALFSVLAMVVGTGAFHEDGFADYCDSFGGHDAKSRLNIMTDSRLGTYGVAGLFFILAARVLLLAYLPIALAGITIVFAAVLSRWLAISLMLNSPYAKEEGKSKPLARAIDRRALAVAAVPLAPFVFLVPVLAIAVLLVMLATFRVGFSAQLKQRLGGFTGDTLGAAQQITEVLVYSGVLAISL